MINRQRRDYTYSLISEEKDRYGQEIILKDQGNINIFISFQTYVLNGILSYSQDKFVGVTHEPITDKYIINYNDKKLKVTHVLPINGKNYIYLEERV